MSVSDFWKQLTAVVWLRFRLGSNKLKRSGTVSMIIARVILVLSVVVAVVALPVGVLAGYAALGSASPSAVFYAWAGVVGAFLFFWLIGVMSELEQAAALSLEKFLHLPVSAAGAFLVNYAGSSFGMALVLFVPVMTGLSIGMVLARGPGMLMLLPLGAAFFLMVTALTYQFQGWLAVMMANPRRRQTVLAVVTLAFVVVFFLPQILVPNAGRRMGERSPEPVDVSPGEEITGSPGSAQSTNPEAAGAEIDESVRRWSTFLPPAWLPLGASDAARGRLLPSLAATLGMALIGAVSLKRAYSTTLRRYTGAFDSGAARAVAPRAGRRWSWVVEARLPRLPEAVSAVATATFRSFSRAPELKMMLLSPVFVLVVFGEMLGWMAGNEAGYMGAVTSFSAAALMLSMSMIGFLGNLFAFDRDGFRVFVLGPVARADVLLGKNLALAPFAFGLMVLAIAVTQWFRPVRPDHLLAVAASLIPMYLLFCLAGNALSILVPIAVKRGSGWPARNMGIKPLIQALVMFALPGLLGLILWPLGLEFLVVVVFDGPSLPIFAVLGVLQAGGAWMLYRRILELQGEWLYRREHRILDAVARQSE